MNIRNYGIAEGRLTKDPVLFKNSDGSRKALLTLAVRDNFSSGAEKTHLTQFISLEAYIKPACQNGVYDLIHKGDLVGVQYSVRSNTYEKNGETIYSQVLQVEAVDIKESKLVTDRRHADSAEY